MHSVSMSSESQRIGVGAVPVVWYAAVKARDGDGDEDRDGDGFLHRLRAGNTGPLQPLANLLLLIAKLTGVGITTQSSRSPAAPW